MSSSRAGSACPRSRVAGPSAPGTARPPGTCPPRPAAQHAPGAVHLLRLLLRQSRSPRRSGHLASLRPAAWPGGRRPVACPITRVCGRDTQSIKARKEALESFNGHSNRKFACATLFQRENYLNIEQNGMQGQLKNPIMPVPLPSGFPWGPSAK